MSRLNQDLNDVLRQPEVRTVLLGKEANAVPMMVGQCATYVAAETSSTPP